MLATIGLLGVLGVLLLASAIETTQWAAANAPAGCPGLDPICRSFNRGMYERYDLVYQVVGFLPLIGPALIGAFWGAPLVAREIERGTFRLAWTQSVPTKRWVAVKLGMLSAAVVLAGAALSIMVTLWNGLFHGAFPDTSLSNPGKFNVVGLAPAAWWLFAFAVGAAAGALIRRTIPAMAVTVAVIAVALPAIIISQDFYAAPAEVIGVDRDTLMNNGDMIVEEKWIGPDGRDMTVPTETLCPPAGGTDASGSRAEIAEQDCLAAKGYQMVFDVQPVNRFWLFQGIQAFILVIAACFCLALAVWGTLRRRT
ncbi:hypothetical protein [Actinoplanes sp. DH11]|uniref:hypothetical protein n=1 Tax=Actinoplanes sp. DH11 TaxID=2857011 RepID=UPI001E3E9CC5|nr:hypothetical protein [Actinoplanes sp. DH11]